MAREVLTSFRRLSDNQAAPRSQHSLAVVVAPALLADEHGASGAVLARNGSSPHLLAAGALSRVADIAIIKRQARSGPGRIAEDRGAFTLQSILDCRTCHRRRIVAADGECLVE